MYLLKIIKPMLYLGLVGFIATAYSQPIERDYEQRKKNDYRSDNYSQPIAIERDYMRRSNPDRYYNNIERERDYEQRKRDHYNNDEDFIAGVCEDVEAAYGQEGLVCDDSSYEEENQANCRNCIVIQNSNIEMNLQVPSLPNGGFPLIESTEDYPDENYSMSKKPSSSSSIDRDYEPRRSREPVSSSSIDRDYTDYSRIRRSSRRIRPSDMVQVENEDNRHTVMCEHIYKNDKYAVESCSYLSESKIFDIYDVHSFLTFPTPEHLSAIDLDTFKEYVHISEYPFVRTVGKYDSADSRHLLHWIANNEDVTYIVKYHLSDNFFPEFLQKTFGISYDPLKTRKMDDYDVHVEQLAQFVEHSLRAEEGLNVYALELFNEAVYDDIVGDEKSFVYFCDIAQHLSTTQWEDWGEESNLYDFIDDIAEYAEDHSLGPKGVEEDYYRNHEKDAWAEYICPALYSHWGIATSVEEVPVQNDASISGSPSADKKHPESSSVSVGEVVANSEPVFNNGSEGEVVANSEPVFNNGSEDEVVANSEPVFNNGSEGEVVANSEPVFNNGSEGEVVANSEPVFNNGSEDEVVANSEPVFNE